MIQTRNIEHVVNPVSATLEIIYQNSEFQNSIFLRVVNYESLYIYYDQMLNLSNANRGKIPHVVLGGIESELPNTFYGLWIFLNDVTVQIRKP